MEWHYSIKEFLVGLSDLSKDALHVHIGVLLYLGACMLFRWKVRDARPWLLVLTIALVNEALDLRYHHAVTQELLWPDSVHDMLNTMALPTVLFLVARWTAVFDQRRGTASGGEAQTPESIEHDIR